MPLQPQCCSRRVLQHHLLLVQGRQRRGWGGKCMENVEMGLAGFLYLFFSQEINSPLSFWTNLLPMLMASRTEKGRGWNKIPGDVKEQKGIVLLWRYQGAPHALPFTLSLPYSFLGSHPVRSWEWDFLLAAEKRGEENKTLCRTLQAAAATVMAKNIVTLAILSKN